MTITLERPTADSAIEVVIDTTNRIPVPTFATILNQLSWSLDEIDRTTRPGKNARVEWGIVEVSGSKSIHAWLAPITMPPSVDMGTVSTAARGLVAGLDGLSTTPEIPQLFTASTVRRVERVSSSISRGRVDAIRVTSVNGSRNETVLTADTAKNAHDAVTGSRTSWGSVTGILDVLDSRHRHGVRAQVYVPMERRAVMIQASPEHVAKLKECWGQEVVAHGQLKRNSRGQVINLGLTLLEEHHPEQAVSAWALLGSNPDFTGPLSTTEYMEVTRGR
jgi:hypothetical protein